MPGHYAAAQVEFGALKQMWAGAGELTIAQAGPVALFGAEVFAWFCVGEVIGRGSLVGYKY